MKPIFILPGRKGFTLIEMLVVIAIMSLLAAMIFPITKAVNRSKLRGRARAELALIETAIQRYKEKLGYFPPGSTNYPVNALYYELLGTSATTGRGGQAARFETLDGSAAIEQSDVRLSFGVDGFGNSTRGGDEGPQAHNFLKGLKPAQIGYYTNRNNTVLRVLVGPAPWPVQLQPLVPGHRGLNPWRYNSQAPVYNQAGFDLWIDLIIDGKTNRISNWSKEVLINPRP